MSKFEKALKLVGKVAEDAAPKAEQAAFKLSQEEIALNREFLKINDRRKAANLPEITRQQFNEYKQTGVVPKEAMTSDTILTKQQGPATLSDSNKAFDPQRSGQVDYMRKGLKQSSGIAPLAAAGELFQAGQESPLGTAATQWNKVKAMLADKLSGQLDLSGGKDKEFQKNASDAIATVADPVNFIPGVGGVAAGALEMLAKDEKNKNKGR